MLADARAILSHPDYVVVPAPPCAEAGTMAWLRASVSRFVSGPEHERRRALVEAELARLDPTRLRAEARSAAAPRNPTRVLAAGLGVPAADLEGVVSAVAAIAPAYLEGARPEDQPAADEAVAFLVALFGPPIPRAVARIAVLVQAHAATAALIANAVEVASGRSLRVDRLLEETLRVRPPVPATRRIGPDGTVVVLDLAAAGCPFGFGPRSCPAEAHALALAAGVLEATLPTWDDRSVDEYAVGDIAAVEALYGDPSPTARDKDITSLDEHCRELIGLAPLCLLATSNASGQCDVSPKGGEPGFVRVLDDRTLAIPDATGNRRVDSLRNIVENPHAGLLFLVPTMGETLRINGRAHISTDPELLQPFAVGRPPRLAIVVEVEQAFLHCAKALVRSRLWKPETWPEETPSAARIFRDHIGLPDQTVESVQATLDESYTNRL